MKYKLQDLVDINLFQSLQDKLNEIYSFPSAIIDNEGNILTAVAWQDICTKFYRANPNSEKECRISDQHILSHIHEANPAVSYKCPHCLIDNALPIVIDGIHYGNFFTGQFFLEPPDFEFFKQQAAKYGFDEGEFIAAVKKVPIWSEDQLKNYLFFIKGLIEVISGMGLKNLKEIEVGKQIKESEEQFRAIFEFAPNGILMLSTTGSFLKVNKALCDMLGYTESELMGFTFKDITYPDDLSLSNEWINQLINNEINVVDFEKRYVHKSGRLVWVNIRALLKRDSTGLPQYFITHIKDITENKQSEEALIKSQAMYQDLVETAQDLIWQCDADGRYVYLNPAWEKIFGYKIEEMLGKKFTDFQTKEWAERDLKEFARLINGNTVQGLETVHLDKEGNEINLIFNAKFVHDAEGKIVGTHGTAFNVTQYKKTLNLLDEKEEKYRSLFENISNSFALHRIVLNEKGIPIDYIFVEANKAFEKQTGVDRNLLIGKKVTEIFPGIENDPFNWIGVYGKVALTGEEIRFEQYFEQLDKWYSVLAYSNKKEHFATIFTDITEQVKTREKISESELRFRSIIEDTEAGYFFIDKVGVFREVNRAWLKLYKYNSVDDVVGKYFTDVQQIDDIEASKAFVEGIMNGNEDFMIGEFSRLCRDGSTGYHSFSARPVLKNGIPIGIEGFIIDTTETKKAEQKLKIREKELQRAEKISGLGNWSIYLNEKIIKCSDGAGEIYGLQNNNFLLEEVQQLVLPQYRTKMNNALNELINNGAAYDIEFKIQRKTDNAIIDIHSIAEYDASNKIVFGIIQDITDRKIAEKELQESEERYRRLLVNLEAGVVVHSKDTSIKFNNQRASELLGLSDDQLRGKLAFDPDWKFIHENYIPFQLNEYPVNRVLAAKKSIRNLILGVVRPKTNDVAWLTVNGFPTLNSKGEMDEILISFIEITEQKRANEEIQKLNQDLENRVIERTEELERSKIDLESKNIELVRFNQLFIGRELRIKELRDKIKDLEENSNKTNNSK